MADEPKKVAETPAQAQPPGQFAVDTTHLSTVYANFCRVTGTPEELVFDFGLNTQMTPVPAQPVKRVHRLVMHFRKASSLVLWAVSVC